MALDPRKRQKKLAKKAARRKKVALQARKESSLGGFLSDARLMAQVVSSPIHQCYVPQDLFKTGIGDVIVSRRLESGKILAAFFLVDVFCLGVKDAFLRLMSPAEFRFSVEKAGEHETLERVDPAYVRKLVEASEAYALGLGLNPHPDYRQARKIFGDIDAAACPAHFEFGQDGKPFYISGPNDSLTRINLIQHALLKSCGPDGFHFLIQIGEPELMDDFDFDEWEEDEDGDEDDDDEVDDDDGAVRFLTPKNEGVA
jgi:hypothetical protein